ncbi:MAG: TRAP transporter substrate-binding protein DctP [Gammaproteobacteria bacterium]|nr:TRAP transporter substrate-binding protein DctP [Gammaproteobacteria bacterium]
MKQLLIAAVALCFSLPSHAVTLKIATLLPDGTSQMQAMRAGGKEIEALTEGRVKFKFYPGGVMGNDASVMRKMRIGQLHGGAFTSGTMADLYPDAQIYSLPFLLKNKAEVDHVRSKFDAEIFAGLEQKGMVPMGLATGGFAYLMSQQPIRRMADVQGKKLWLPQGDKLVESAIKEIGGNGVPLGLGDVYTGLQTGLIDTAGTSPAGAIALQWYTQIKYVTDYPLGYLAGWLAIGTKAWKKLTPADQKTVKTVWAKVYDQIDADTWAGADNAIDALKNQGVEFVPLDADDVMNWQAATERTLVDAGNAGAYNPETLVRLRDELERYRATQ